MLYYLLFSVILLLVINNNVSCTEVDGTFIFLIATEGSGHHGLGNLIRSIVQFVGYNLDPLPTMQHRQEFGPHLVQEAFWTRNATMLHIGYHQRWNVTRPKWKIKYRNNLNHVVVVDTVTSFPFMSYCRTCTADQIPQDSHYDLQWMFENSKGLVKVKYLYINRDFYWMVNSHEELDGGFRQHAEVMANFKEHILRQYYLTESQSPGLWKQINYEWFGAQDCTTIVSALIEFLEFPTGAEERTCKWVALHFKPSSKPEGGMDPDKLSVVTDVLNRTPAIKSSPIPILGNLSFSSSNSPIDR